MKLIRSLAALIALACAMPVAAQTTTAVVVSSCGTPPTTYTAGQIRQITQDATGTLCTPSGGGSGGAITAADGAITTIGAKADAAWTSGAGTIDAILKAIDRDVLAPLAAGTNAIGSITNTSFGISGTLPAFGSTPTFTDGSFVAQASTTSGQTGPLIQGAVTTGTPTYTTAQTSPLSLTPGGALRGDITSVAGNAAASAAANGSSVYGLGIYQTTAVPNTDQSATAFAGSGSVLGTAVASVHGGGAVVSAEINVSALTLGTASSVIFCLQQSAGGTNFSDIWCGDPVTATGTYSVPAVSVMGRRRWRAFSVGGTSTTVTATISALELPTGFPLIRQGRDAYSATNPFATMYNSAALAASTFVLTTVNSATTPFYIEGAKQVTGFISVTGSPTITTSPIVGLQLSNDGVNWFSSGASAVTLSANGSYALNSIYTAKFARMTVNTAAVFSSGAFTISLIGVNAVN